jgi:hypothetical protein
VLIITIIHRNIGQIKTVCGRNSTESEAKMREFAGCRARSKSAEAKEAQVMVLISAARKKGRAHIKPTSRGALTMEQQ